METNNKIAPHETFDIHELLTLKTVSATKASAMVALVTDEELKKIFQQELINTQAQIQELKSLLQNSVLAEKEAEDK